MGISEMATPGQLVEVMAEALGVPVETVTNYDRVLSENGMRSKSGRGRGAAKVTAGDAANLLIAIMGSPIAGASVKEAANTCHRYGSLPALGHVDGTQTFAKVGLGIMDELPQKNTLRDGISILIASAAKGQHLRIRGLGKDTETNDRYCYIRLSGPRPWAEIFARSLVRDGKQEFARRVYTKSDSSFARTDLQQERVITYRTIRKLGSLLSEERN
jgi:hypothetical protein